MEEIRPTFKRVGSGNRAFSFSKLTNQIRGIYRLYYGTSTKIEEDDYMLWIGIALVLIGVFLIGKSSN